MQRLKSVRTNGRLSIVRPAEKKGDRFDTADLMRSIDDLKERVREMSLMLEVSEAFGSAGLESGADFYKNVRRFEISLIKRALQLSGGSQTQAARLLKVKMTTLNSKIKRYRIG